MIFCFCFSKTSVENFINTLQIYFQNVDGNFHRHFASISKSESNLQGFQSNISGNKFIENEQFLLKRFTSGKNIVLKGFLTIPWVRMSKFALG